MRAMRLTAPTMACEVMEHLHGHGNPVADTDLQPVPGWWSSQLTPEEVEEPSRLIDRMGTHRG
jgi:hypothetical protein